MNPISKTWQRASGSILASALVVLLAATLYVPTARAQSVSELQALVAQLLAQITAQQGSGAVSTACPHVWTRPLSQGSSGADVLKLQQFLNSSADTRLAATGAGSPGMETQYYGPVTAAAVSKFQAKYRADILTPLGLSNPTGYFGASSMAKANALCVTGSPTTPGGSNGGNSGELRGGAGFLEDVDYVSAINKEKVGEGEKNVDVIGLELEVDGGSDLRLTAIRVAFKENSAGGSDDFDDYAEEVSVWLDGDEVGSMDVDDMRESKGVWTGTISLDKSAVVRRGDVGELTIAVSALRNIDSSDLGSSNNDWRGGVTMVRYVDANGAAITESSLGDIISVNQLGSDGRAFHFDTFASASGVELRLSESSDNPSAGTVHVDEDGGDEVVLLVGELRGKGSDIEISKLRTTITPVGASVEEMAANFILRIDGDEVATVRANDCLDEANDCSDDDGQAATYVFDDIDYILEKDDTVDFEIVVELLEFGGDFSEEDSLEALVSASDIEAEDESGDDLSGSELRGTVSGEAIRFASSGLNVEMTKTTATILTNISSDSSDDQGQYVMEFRVTAFEDTAWIRLNAGSSTNAVGDALGVAYTIENASNGDTVADGTSYAVLARVSGGNVVGDYVRINAGQTATFRLTVYYDAAATGIYRAQMNQIGYNQNSAAAANRAHALQPEANFDSESVQVMN